MPACCPGATDAPLVIPALNRDGDCLSDLVLPMFGSIAGAESVLLAFDDEYATTVAMAEAPHGTAPALQGKDLANPLAMILACGAVLRYAAERTEPRPSARLERSMKQRSRPSPRASGPRTSAATPARRSSPTRSWNGCGRSSISGPPCDPDSGRSVRHDAAAGDSVRALPYSHEHMFQASANRLRTFMSVGRGRPRRPGGRRARTPPQLHLAPAPAPAALGARPPPGHRRSPSRPLHLPRAGGQRAPRAATLPFGSESSARRRPP